MTTDPELAGAIATLAGPFEIWADGACSGNPGPGGWAAILRNPAGKEKEISGAAADTTNNQMELTAALEALKVLSKPSRVTMRCDSQYVVRGMTEWLPGWRARGWKKGDGKPVVNRELWEKLAAAEARHEVTWEWVRGHAGDTMNERVDRLAVQARVRYLGS